jgi:hypothetical protein
MYTVEGWWLVLDGLEPNCIQKKRLFYFEMHTHYAHVEEYQQEKNNNS